MASSKGKSTRLVTSSGTDTDEGLPPLPHLRRDRRRTDAAASGARTQGPSELPAIDVARLSRSLAELKASVRRLELLARSGALPVAGHIDAAAGSAARQIAEIEDAIDKARQPPTPS
jgi:hypothetical protein